MGHYIDAHVFVQVVESGSIRAASVALGMPKSTVARRIAELEQALGVRLLERTTRRMRMSDAGQRYFTEAAPAVRALERATTAATELQHAPRGTLRITIPVNLALPFVPRMMRAFCALYPELRVAIELDDRPTDFVRDGIDVALRTTPGALKDSSLVSLKLSESPLRLYASPRYLAARGTPRRAADLEAHDCLIRPTRGRARWVLSHGDEQTELQPVGKVAVRSEAVLRDLAIEGLGIALLSESECRAALASGALVPVLRTLTGGSEALYVLHAGGPYVPSKVRAFVDFVRGQLGEVRRTRQLAISE